MVDYENDIPGAPTRTKQDSVLGFEGIVSSGRRHKATQVARHQS
jgi:hypothetical protein